MTDRRRTGSERRQRTAVVVVRLLPAEREALQAVANRRGVSVSPSWSGLARSQPHKGQRVMPERIQLRRTKGFRLRDISPNAIVVARPTKWGNPWVVHMHTLARCGPDLIHCPPYIADDRADAVRKYRHALLYPLMYDPPMPDVDEIRYQLRGHDLACWCPPGPCHADVLLGLAND